MAEGTLSKGAKNLSKQYVFKVFSGEFLLFFRKNLGSSYGG